MFWRAARHPHLSLGGLWRGSAGEVVVRGAAALWQEDKDVQELFSWTEVVLCCLLLASADWRIWGGAGTPEKIHRCPR